MSNNAKDNVSVIKEQINNFDNKANILIAIVSIVFTLSLNMLDYVNNLKLGLPENHIKYIIFLIIFCVYCAVFSIEIIFLVLVIYPRKNQSDKLKSAHYYLHLSRMTRDEIASTLAKSSEESDIEQLQVTSRICAKKHKFIVCAIWSLIPLFVLLFAMCFVVII